MSSPSSRIVPSVGSSRRSSTLPTVDLPQPDSPTRHSVSPGLIAKLTPSTAFTIATRAREQAALQRKMLLQVLDFDDRAHAAARSDASTRSASWQATTWPVPIGRNSGASTRQRATA